MKPLLYIYSIINQTNKLKNHDHDKRNQHTNRTYRKRKS
jgi:hypothetical protein